jgi:hypothetical protein
MLLLLRRHLKFIKGEQLAKEMSKIRNVTSFDTNRLRATPLPVLLGVSLIGMWPLSEATADVAQTKSRPKAACVSVPAWRQTLSLDLQSGASSLTGNTAQLAGIDADVGQIACVQALELGQRLTLTAPGDNALNQSSKQHDLILVANWPGANSPLPFTIVLMRPFEIAR